ncbi:MAG: hypothetical protein RL685_923, partial [Pseudomonadota bacterium]
MGVGQLEGMAGSGGSGAVSNGVGSNGVGSNGVGSNGVRNDAEGSDGAPNDAAGSDGVGSDVVSAAEGDPPAGGSSPSSPASEPPSAPPAPPLTGGGLVSSTTTHEFGLLEVASGVAQLDWVIENVTDLPIDTPLPTMTNAIDFQITRRCTESLAPHTSCVVGVAFMPLATGPRSSTLRMVASDGSTLELTVTGSGGRRVSIERNGQGSGEIISQPPGITCGETCSGLFEGNVVQLEARTSNGSGALFTGWSAPECPGLGRVCNLSLSSSRSVAA